MVRDALVQFRQRTRATLYSFQQMYFVAKSYLAFLSVRLVPKVLWGQIWGRNIKNNINPLI